MTRLELALIAAGTAAAVSMAANPGKVELWPSHDRMPHELRAPLAGFGCAGATHVLYAWEEDQFPPCLAILPTGVESDK